jgi:tetratricopeptide (TPR) repeat protein
MKPTRHITAALLLPALAVVGCSKAADTAPAKSPASEAAPMPRVLAQPPSLASTVDDEEGPVTVAAIKIGPASFADGEAAYQGGKYAEAAAFFEHYTAERPDNAWGHYMLGLSAWKRGDLAKSEQAFDKALSIDPRHVKSLVNSSRVLIEQKRHEDALERLTQAASLEPGSADVYRLLGRVQSTQGKTEEAVDSYRQAIELNERDAWSMNNLGLLFLETQRAAEALPLLTRAVELRQDVAVFHNNLGMALEHTGRFKAAATAYHGALAADPNYDKAIRNLARVEAVKVDAEEPLDIERTAQGAEGTKSPEEVKKPTI